MAQQKIKIDAINQNFLPAAMGVFNAEDHIKIQLVTFGFCLKVSVVITQHPFFPGKSGIHAGVAMDEMVCQHQSGKACVFVGTHHFSGGAVGAFAA